MKKIGALGALFIVLSSFPLMAEEYWEKTDPLTGKVLFMRAKSLDAQADKGANFDLRALADRFVSEYGARFGASQGLKEFYLHRIEKDSQGIEHFKYRQHIRGIPVFGADLFVHAGANGVTAANGRAVSELGVRTAASVARVKAAAAAKEAWKRQFPLYKPEVNRIKRWVLAPGLINNSNDNRTYLVWEVTISGPSGYPFEYYYIDAQTKKLRWQRTGTAEIDRRIRDCSRYNPPIYCLLDSCYYFGGPLYCYGRSEGKPVRGPNPVYGDTNVDDMYDLYVPLQAYWLNRFGRNGINGLGGTGNQTASSDYWWTRSHADTYRDPIWGDKCPFWAMWSNWGSILFCAHVFTVSPGVFIYDLIAHEHGHGLPFFSQWNGSTPVGMVYEGQSGALNESQADYWGVMWELEQTGVLDWWMFDLWSIGPARYLADPPVLSYPRIDPIAPYPDRFHSGNLYCGTEDNGGVHWNSTVVSKAMYLMTEGGEFNGCAVEGLGTDEVEQILYGAVTQYYTSTETFNGAFYGLLQACLDRNGEGFESPCRDVLKALQAVEMDQPGYCSGAQANPATCRCEDTDDWLSLGEPFPFEFGEATIGGEVFEDQCVGRCGLIEQVCVNGERHEQHIDCEYGCNEGKCNTSGLRCSGDKTGKTGPPEKISVFEAKILP